LEQDEGALTLSPDLHGRIDAWRDTQKPRPTRSQAINELVRIGLRSAESPSVSPGEKLILSMLCDLNRKVEAKGMIDPDFLEYAIQGGHIWALEWQYPSLAHRHVNGQAHADLVIRILTMWGLIEKSFHALPEAEKARIMQDAGLTAEPSFPGWHDESEANYRSIARFMTERMKLFPAFRRHAGRVSGEILVGRYKKMLQYFDELESDVADRLLTGSELAGLLEQFHIGR
jgi:uncharacterized protein YfbU (UPF0304 family)